MPRWKFLRKLSLLAFSLALGVTFAPRLAPPIQAQDDDEGEGEDPMQGLTPEQKKEIQSIQKAQQKANEAIQSEDYEAGVKVFKKLCEKLDKSNLPEKVLNMLGQVKLNAHYNYACCLSRTGAKDEAVKEFDKSVQLGFFDWKHIAEDKDLDAIREMDDFKKAVEGGKKLEIEKLVSQVKSGKSLGDLSFEAEGADGKKRTAESYKGKVLVLALLSAEREEGMAAEAAFFQKASDELKEKGLEVVGMVFGAEKENLKDIADKNKIKFDLVVGDPSDSIKALARTGASVFLVDRSGKVRGAAAGVNQADVVTAAAKPLLEEAASEKKDDGKKDEGKKDEKKDSKKKEDF